MIGAVELEPGTLVDGWQITRALRTGGFGAVHQAEQRGKAFAIKVALHREESGDTGRTHARALREVALLLTIDHPHIIKARGFGYLPDGRVYCVLEYVDGWTLGDWLERTHPTFREIARVFAKIAGAVEYLHSQGVLHRDLKLSNVMVRRNGEPVLIDLGSATYANAEELTATPLPPGTERYRAPEAREFFYQQGREQGARYPFKVADELFAVGVMLYELLTEPLPSKNPLRPGFARPVENLLPAREANPRVPQAFSALVEELLARAPAHRPESFEALRRRLAELAHHPGPEYEAEAHPPSAQRQPPHGDKAPAAGLKARGRQLWQQMLALADGQPLRRHGWLPPRALVGLAAAAVLTATVAVWLARGEHRAPALPPVPSGASAPAVPGASPSLPPVKSSPESPPAPEQAQGSAPAAPATAPKEGSTVKPQPPDALKSPRAARAPKTALTPTDPGFPAWCKTLPLAVAIAHGCTAASFKAEPFECPPGAQDAMSDALGWDILNDRFNLHLDERGPRRGLWGFTPGAPVTGRVPDTLLPGRQLQAPPRTLFHGRVYIGEKTSGAPLGELVIIYDQVEIPGKGKFPVCVVSELNAVREWKNGTAMAQNNLMATPVINWKPPR